MKKTKNSILLAHRKMLNEYCDRWAHYFDPTEVDDLFKLNLKAMQSELIAIIDKVTYHHERETYDAKVRLMKCKEFKNNSFIKFIYLLWNKLKR